MRTIQISDCNVIAVISEPIPDLHLILRSVEHFDSHLLERRRVRLLMHEVITEEFYDKSLLDEHLQILKRRLGTGILVVGRHIVVNDKNNRLALTALTCAERIRIAIILTLLLKLLCPLFLKLLGVCNLITLESGSLHIGSVGNALEMNHF